MQNNYIKELATKSYQEEIQKEYYSSQRVSFHTPSFLVGSLMSIVLLNLF